MKTSWIDSVRSTANQIANVAASASVDEKLEGANPIDVYVKLPAGQTLVFRSSTFSA